MIEKPYEIAVIKVQDLQDLVLMAQKAPAYREGQAWTACAMHEANKAINGALIRARQQTGKLPL